MMDVEMVKDGTIMLTKTFIMVIGSMMKKMVTDNSTIIRVIYIGVTGKKA